MAALQVGLFGHVTTLEDHHVVAAHTRLLPDGSEAFVAEHLRKNRGRHARPSVGPRLPEETPPEQPTLFDVAG